MKFDSMVDKLMNDPSFRDGLRTDPEGTLKAHNFDAHPEKVEALKNVDWSSLDKVRDSFQDDDSVC